MRNVTAAEKLRHDKPKVLFYDQWGRGIADRWVIERTALTWLSVVDKLHRYFLAVDNFSNMIHHLDTKFKIQFWKYNHKLKMLTFKRTPIGWRPQIVLPYFLRYSVNPAVSSISMIDMPCGNKSEFVFQSYILSLLEPPNLVV